MNGNSKGIWLTAGVALLICIGAWSWMNQGYAKIGDSGYQYALALVSACNRQDLERVQTIVQNVRQAKDEGELSAYDARVLEEIGELAIEGNWEKAAANARKLLKAQVSRAASLRADADFCVGRPFQDFGEEGLGGNGLGGKAESRREADSTSQRWGYAASRYPEPLFWQNSLTVEKPANYIA